MADTTSGQGGAVKKAGDQVEAKKPTVEDYADVVDAPDPDEDDLDDLDDMLEDFSAAKIDSTKPAAPSGPGRPVSSPSVVTANGVSAEPDLEDMLSDDDFAKKLQDEMAQMMGGLGDDPDMASQFDKMFRDIAAAAGEIDAAPAASASASASDSAAQAPADAAATEASFQETIRRTMERMRTSGEQATAAATEAGGDDMLADMLKSLQSGDLEGMDGEEEFSKMLLGMMEQLTNKDILYEPMKELNDKFPEWMEKNKSKTSAEDLKRYEEQQVLVKEIVAKFEEPSYTDSNTADREYIVDRMQKMQAAGSPPDDLVGDMPSAQEAMNMPDEGCNPQ